MKHDELARVVLALEAAAFDLVAANPCRATVDLLARAMSALAALTAVPLDEPEQRDALAAFLLARHGDLARRARTTGTVH